MKQKVIVAACYYGALAAGVLTREFVILMLMVAMVLSYPPILRPIRASSENGQVSLAPVADYGDAPEGTLAGYNEPFEDVIGKFPTQFETTNSRLGLPGAHTLKTGEETLGLDVSAERDATDPADPDGVVNLVDQDGFDDGLSIGFDEATLTPETVDLVVSVAETAPDVTRYINVLLDRNHDGMWQEFDATEEWVVKNQAVNIAPGSQNIAVQLPFSLITEVSPTWMRVALTRTPIDEAAFSAVGGWDGSGEFEFGEIEDHLLAAASAVDSAFAQARAAKAALAVCLAHKEAITELLMAADQDFAQAIAAACAQVQASASAAADAEANAQASVSAAAGAVSAAEVSALVAQVLVTQLPCLTVVTNLRVVINAIVRCAADARAQAAAHASAAAAAATQIDAYAAACAGAQADANAAAAAIASAEAKASALAIAVAQAVAQAVAGATASAQAIELGGRRAILQAAAQAAAAAQAQATAGTACLAIAAALASAQAHAQALARARAIAESAAGAAAYAATVAMNAADAAANAQASAVSAADASAATRASIATLTNPECQNKFCEEGGTKKTAATTSGKPRTVPPHHPIVQAVTGLLALKGGQQ